jgi:ssDNA-binding Zn-finger/Zn-ribbon topoisomerase 1
LAKDGDLELSEPVDITGSEDSHVVDTLSVETSGFPEGDELTEEAPQSGSAEALEESASPTSLEGTVEEADDTESPAIADQAEDDDLNQEATPTAEIPDETESVSQQNTAEISDDDLEAQIAAFEQDLAMTCPLCGGGKVETKKTAKGKNFYVCTQQDCVFVSWGKPYHLECPWCKNPFLIEASGKAGKTILRCPRATCRYQQGMPGEGDPSLVQSTADVHGATPSNKAVRRPRKRKRAVRRRVVRRKRK